MPVYYLVAAPGDGPVTDHDRALLEEFATERLSPRATVITIDRAAAIDAGACGQCPAGCPECTGERSGCDCHEHADEPDPAYPRRAALVALNEAWIRCVPYGDDREGVRQLRAAAARFLDIVMPAAGGPR